MKTKRKKNLVIDNIAYLFIAPFCLFTLYFVLIPIAVNIVLSFTNYDLRIMDFIGLTNYIFMLTDASFTRSLWNSFVFTFFTLFFSMAIGLAISLALKSSIPGLSFYRASFYVPYVTSMVAISMVWLWMLEPTNGIINKIFKLFGLPGANWLFDARTAMFSIIFVSIWKSIGYYMVIFLAGLQGIPKYLYEAALIDGASPIKRFTAITWPMLMPITFFLFITGFINCFKVFEQVQIMTGGGPMNSTTTIVHQIYNRAFNEMRLGYAAAESVILLLVIAFITILNFKFGNQGNDLEAA